MISKELLEKARKCTSKEELLELAKKENVEVSDDEIQALLATTGTNKELSDEELENVTGGTCHSSCTYYDLGITPDELQNIYYHPVITTAGNWCDLYRGRPNLAGCNVCEFHYTIGPTIYCRKRSKEKDFC